MSEDIHRTLAMRAVMNVNDEQEFEVMIYKHKGRNCITFAALSEDGILVQAPFPPDLIKDEELREEFALKLEEDGYYLTWDQDQLKMPH